MGAAHPAAEDNNRKQAFSLPIERMTYFGGDDDGGSSGVVRYYPAQSV